VADSNNHVQQMATTASSTVLIITATILIYVAWNDLRQFKIRNEVLLVLTALFLLHAVLSGRSTTLPGNFAFAGLLFGIMLYFFSIRLMGGGDLKLLTVAFLWVGPSCALRYALLLLIFVALFALAVRINLVGAKIIEGRRLIAFAPPIVAALIGTFIIGCDCSARLGFLPLPCERSEPLAYTF
jgi:prepilin peptidase CpaA